VQRISRETVVHYFVDFSATQISQFEEMNRILQASSFHLRTLRFRPLSSVMTALYSTSSLKLANAMPFNSLSEKLDSGILKALDEMQYEYMTPVQEKVLSSMPSLRSDW
jgi:hypothetical protein